MTTISRLTLTTVNCIDYVEKMVDSAFEAIGERPYRFCNRMLSHLGIPLSRVDQAIEDAFENAKYNLLVTDHDSSEDTEEAELPRVFQENRRFNGGPVSEEKVERHFQKLQSHVPSGISFEKSKIEKNLTGGICSAKSFAFAEQYFKIKKEVFGTDSSASKASPQVLMKARLKKLATFFVTGAETFRNRQMAFNTITCYSTTDDATEYVDYGKKKIQALANFHHFEITHASKELSVDDTEETFLGEVNSLPEGVYILRVISPTYNDKLENYGHTLVYIKENGLNLLYDPGEGLIDLSCKPDALNQEFHDLADDWGLENARFYRIVESASKPPIPASSKTRSSLLRARL